MPNPLSPIEWCERAAIAGIEWVAIPKTATTPTPARCLECGYEWALLPNHLNRGTRCPKCVNVSRRIPHAEWDRRAKAAGISIVTYPKNTMTDKIRIRCLTCDYEWSALSKGINWTSACPKCRKVNSPRKSGKPPSAVSREEWDRRAALVGIDWLEDPKGGNDAFKARCLKCGYEYKAYTTGVYSGKGCKKCSARAQRLDSGEWDRRAALVGIEWLKPPTTRRSKTPARCLTCGYQWEANPGSVGSHGCPKCGNAVPITPAEYKQRAKAAGIEWLESPRGTVSKTPARCLTCGYEWEALPSHIQAGTGCPSCSNNLPVSDQEWDRRILACGMEWIAYPNTSDTQGIARCLTCGYEGLKYAQAASRGAGCPVCTMPSFDPTAPSLVYLVYLAGPELLKVGKTNATAKNDRIKTHRKRGWEVVQLWPVSDGDLASRAERAVLDYWRERNAPKVRPDEVPDGDGYTETIQIGRVDIPETIRVINEIVALQPD